MEQPTDPSEPREPTARAESAEAPEAADADAADAIDPSEPGDHPGESDPRHRIEQACRRLEATLDEDVPLDELARVAHFSPFHFHRLFRGLTGETVRGYARRLRLERAAHRLLHGDAEIGALALELGYGSPEAFSRAFTKRFGVTPTAYRAARQDPKPPRRDDPGRAAGVAVDIDVRIERRDPTPYACVRHVGPYPDVGVAWKTLMKWGWTKMLFGRRETFGLCFDDPDVTEPERVRYEACMVVKPGTRVRGPVQRAEHDGGTFAVTRHDGPYALLGETYAALFAAVATQPIDGIRYRLGDPPSLEVYLNDPRSTEPDALRTEVWMPVHRARA